MSIFGNTHGHATGALHKMVKFTAFASPQAPPLEGQFPADSRTGTVHLPADITSVLSDIYDELRGEAKLLSKGKFEHFLRETQGEKTVSLENKYYTLSDFQATWYFKYSWNAAAPLPVKDLTRPLTDYFISSSHNTYLEGHQILSKSSAQAYENVLRKGGRCIEIDVWDGEPATPRSSSKSPANQHNRQSSSTSLTHAFDEARETTRKYLGSASHSRSVSCNSATLVEDSPKSSLHAFPSTAGRNERLHLPQTPAVRGRSHIAKGEPVVRHGPMLTYYCGFREVAEAIRDTAFVDSDLPIIISFEIHAGLEQQEVMVNIMEEVWQDMLLSVPHDECDPQSQVPRLEQLRGKILIKAKRAHESSSQPLISISAPTTQTELGHEQQSHQVAKLGKSMSTSAAAASEQPHDSNSKVPIHENLKNLAIYTRGVKFEGLDTTQATQPNHIFSISEDDIFDLDEKHHRAMFLHNKSYFMRSYPVGFKRVNSSNYNPAYFWRKGVQMVTMNWQYPDDGMMLNYGMFADEMGWVLKPPGYRSSDASSQTQKEAATVHTMDMSLTIFKAQHIPVKGQGEEAERHGSALHTFTKAEIRTGRFIDFKKDSTLTDDTHAKKTHVYKSDHPSFGREGQKGETLTFRDIPNVVEELSFLLIKIDEVGVTGSGYRFIQLMDMTGHPVTGGRLFVKVTKELR
ncbi:phospholipase C [Cordyceps javanica]|uniref:Phosphoinositide phospholipase C n=1 Tax=Cordyceps javanica TaxID=43265 RepID=A0A545UVB6_9HYPO|nr:phospholipase C [Cordyceps javanica]TQW05245.1 phospholipase C [Cordyceps javanica]